MNHFLLKLKTLSEDRVFRTESAEFPLLLKILLSRKSTGMAFHHPNSLQFMKIFLRVFLENL